MRVLQHRGRAAIVFGGDEDEAVELGDLLLPLLGDLVLRRAPGRRNGLVEERQRIVAQVENFDVDIAAGARYLRDPFGRLVGKPVRPGAADDDADFRLGHCRVLSIELVTNGDRHYISDCQERARRHFFETKAHACNRGLPRGQRHPAAHRRQMDGAGGRASSAQGRCASASCAP